MKRTKFLYPLNIFLSKTKGQTNRNSILKCPGIKLSGLCNSTWAIKGDVEKLHSNLSDNYEL